MKAVTGTLAIAGPLIAEAAPAMRGATAAITETAEATALRVELQVSSQADTHVVKAVNAATGDTVGKIGGSFTPASETLQIHGVAVDPTLQGQGLGTKLYESLLQRCEQDGTVSTMEGQAGGVNKELLKSGVSVDALPSIKIRTKLGFTEHKVSESGTMTSTR